MNTSATPDPKLAAEAPLSALVSSLEHLRGKGLPELVKAARWRRKRVTLKPVEAAVAVVAEPQESLADVLRRAREERGKEGGV